VVGIVDRESAQAWLVEAPRKAQITLAARSAVRALPAVTIEQAVVNDVILATFRATLTSCVAGIRPDGDGLRAAAAQAFNALQDIELSEPRAVKATDAMASALSAVRRIRVSSDTAGLLIGSADEAAADAVGATAGAFGDACWSSADADATALELFPSQDVFRRPLWPSTATRTADDLWRHDQFAAFLRSDHSRWAFWYRWYEGMLDGRPLDWELQYEITLIPDEDWEKGCNHIARLIQEVEARFALKARIRELENELVQASRDRFGLGGNNPPEGIEDAPSVAKEFTIIWAPLQDLKLEAEKVQPDRTIVRRAAEGLRDTLEACGLWSARKLDAAATAAVIAAGTALGTAFAAWMAGHGDKVMKVIDAAEALLAALR
jgi:hypothetical protein